MTDDEVVFFSWQYRRSRAIRLGLVFFLLLSLFLDMLRGPSSSIIELYEGIVAAAVVVAGIGLVRTRWIGITLTPAAVISHSAYSTRHFAWEDLRRAQAIERRVRPTRGAVVPTFGKYEPPTRVLPVLELTDGRRQRLYGLQAVVPAYAYEDWVVDAIAAINERLDERAAGGPTPR